MKTRLLLLALFIVVPLYALFAQVNGNGKLETQTRSVGIFSILEINFPAEVEIECGTLPRVEITAEENLMKYIKVDHSGNKLSIEPTKWIEPRKQIQIRVGVAFLHRLNTSGYGNYWVRNLNTPSFHLQNLVGTTVLEGAVKDLTIQQETGQVDATQLEVTNAQVKIWSHGKARVKVSGTLNAEVADEGIVIYEGKPEKLEKKTKSGGVVIDAASHVEETPPEIKYISLTLHNNSRGKIDIYIKGPPHRRFSYGAPFRANQKREENFPVGTKIYLDKVFTRKLLLKIEEAHEGKVVSLFE